jgi:hypothetical protein
MESPPSFVLGRLCSAGHFWLLPGNSLQVAAILDGLFGPVLLLLR